VCGRYASSANPDDLVEVFEVDEVAEAARELGPDFNVAPTASVPVVLERRHRDASGEPVGDPTRRLRTARWGLVPSWAKDAAIGNRMINARAETLADKPAFRRAYARRRCLLPADGYYEWRSPSEASARPGKQPFFITSADGRPLAMAGLYEIWHDPAAPPEEPTSWLWTVTVVTTDAGPDLVAIHDRMPVLVDAADYDRWLDPEVTPALVADLLRPSGAGTMQAVPVATTVNNVRNNGPELIRPIPAEESDGLW